MRPKKKNPLYRKVNTRARNVHHKFGKDYSKSKRTKRPDTSMKKGVKRGLDYTPLFKFLLSKVGKDWTQVHSEAVSRLDTSEPISWMVLKNCDTGSPLFRQGEATYFSTLYVDEDNILQKIDPTMGPEKLRPCCDCCTHTFNGSVFIKKFDGLENGLMGQK